MEEATEKRVWQRVRGEPERTELLRACLLRQGKLLGTYRQLAGRGGKYRRLWEQKLEQVSCLRGLLRVMTLQSVCQPQTQTGPVELLRCFEEERRTLNDLNGLCRDEELGDVAELLRDRQRQQLRLLLELIGTA